ncbi:tetratricopeptide repeat protein [Alkalihalobacillus sp. R86527]|uniref:tetratricopeptide repeat protein n=1 Tax=Alkalihalobacillus sp. R86527 TaxID=3093863 RepID=UPI00366FD47C
MQKATFLLRNIKIGYEGCIVIELRPKHSLTKRNDSASRQFTDRKEPTAAFTQAFQQKQDAYHVLTYYGVGGVGKTRLQKELYEFVHSIDSDAIKASLDFKEPKLRHSGEALIWLKKALQKKNPVKFTTFDLAYTVYWSKLNPQLSLKSKNIDLPFIEEGSFVGELVHYLEDVPIAQWLPKTLKLMNGMTRYKDMMSWWLGSGKHVLTELQDMLPGEIEEKLPMYFAADLNAYLAKKHVSAVIFLDTFEALWEVDRNVGSFHQKDEWVRELVLQLPQVLWVICGREKLRWEEVNPAWKEALDQHLIGELSEEDSKNFLLSCGITDKEVQDVILKSSQGLPYYLDLMVDTYNVLNEKQTPAPADFSRRPQKILDRFLQYLELSEKETIKLLSFPRNWDTEIFHHLITHFKTGYPVTAYKELFRFSFINRIDHERWDMQELVRRSLQDHVKEETPPLYQKVHEWLFYYYDELKHDGVRSFQEAFYHGSKVKGNEELLRWFLRTGSEYYSNGQFSVITSLHTEVISHLEKIDEEELVGDIHLFLGEVQLLQGEYELALMNYQASIESFIKALVDDRSQLIEKLGKCAMDMAEMKIHLNSYAEAYKLLEEASKYFRSYKGKKSTGFFENYSLQQIRLGKLHIRFAEYEKSEANYQNALVQCDEGLKLNHDSVNLLSLKALAYEKLGELSSKVPSQQGEYYRRSIEYYELASKDSTHKDYLRIRTNMGLAHKRMGEHLDSNNHLGEKKLSFEKALMIYNEVLEKSPNFVDALEKKGHASIDYMVLLRNIGFYDQSIHYFEIGTEAFSKALAIAPGQGGSRNRIASAYRELAILFMDRLDFDRAFENLTTSLSYFEEMKIYSPNYVYLCNSTGKTFQTFGDYYLKVNKVHDAIESYEKAKKSFAAMLSKAPGLREASERIEVLERVIWKLKEHN